MRLTCPGCGAHGSLELFGADADARAFAASMGELPPALAAPVREYLALFRPRQRVLTWPRARKLLAELLPDIKSERIERKGRIWPAPAAVWQSAIEQMVASRDKLTLPLKSHGYLHEIIVGLADKVEAAAERTQEEAVRTGAARTAGSRQYAQILLNGERQARQRLKLAPMTPEEEHEFLRRAEARA